MLCGPAAAAPGRAREHRAGVGARASARVRVGLGAALGRGGARACAAAARCGAGSEASHMLSHQPRSATPRNSTSCAGTSATPPTRLYSNSTAASRRPAARAGRVRMPLQRAHGHANLGRGSHPEPHQNMIGHATLPLQSPQPCELGDRNTAPQHTPAVWLRPTLRKRIPHTHRAAGRGRAAAARHARGRHLQGPRKRQAGPTGVIAAQAPRPPAPHRRP